MKMVLMSAVLLANGMFLAGQAGEMPSPQAVKAITQRVADWQIQTFDESGKYRALKGWQMKNRIETGEYPEKHHELDWTMGALYAGMNEWRKVADNPAKYTNWLYEIGTRHAWKLHKRKYHADDHAVGQFYLSLYDDYRDPVMLAPAQATFDSILAAPKTGSLEWMTREMRQKKIYTDSNSRWGWADSLFMAPPVWTRLAKVTGDRKYLDFMDQEYHATYDFLWDEEDHFFWRDSSYFPKREKNGRNLYWARGNGWVFGGLALMIPDMPKDWAGRPFYIDVFSKMSASLKGCQRADGTWSMGLLGGVEGYPIKDVSGTSFFTFGLAWGLNNGVLDRATYEPVVLKAWTALTECVRPDGLLGYVQPIGAAPGDSYADYSEVYGVGAFLAAGAEVYKLAGGSVNPEKPALTLIKSEPVPENIDSL